MAKKKIEEIISIEELENEEVEETIDITTSEILEELSEKNDELKRIIVEELATTIDKVDELSETVEKIVEEIQISYLDKLNIPYCSECKQPFQIDLNGNKFCPINQTDCSYISS